MSIYLYFAVQFLFFYLLQIFCLCVSGDKVLSPLSYYPTPSLGYHVLPQNFSHLHQTVSEEKHPYDFQKLTHLPMLFFPSLFLLFPTFSSLNIIISNFCFPSSSLPCHKMYSDFSTKTVTITFSPLLFP